MHWYMSLVQDECLAISPYLNSINDIIRRAFTSVSVAATLEPRGLTRDDGKRPDSMTLIPRRWVGL